MLIVMWNPTEDALIFDVSDMAQAMSGIEPTKRNVVSLTARFLDALCTISPVTVLFKMFFQKLCEAKTEWDETLFRELFKNGGGYALPYQDSHNTTILV
jgi:hypothetical protein